MLGQKNPFRGFSEGHKRILKDALSCYSDELYQKCVRIESQPHFESDDALQEQYDEYLTEMHVADALCAELLKLMN